MDSRSAKEGTACSGEREGRKVLRVSQVKDDKSAYNPLHTSPDLACVRHVQLVYDWLARLLWACAYTNRIVPGQGEEGLEMETPQVRLIGYVLAQ